MHGPLLMVALLARSRAACPPGMSPQARPRPGFLEHGATPGPPWLATPVPHEVDLAGICHGWPIPVVESGQRGPHRIDHAGRLRLAVLQSALDCLAGAVLCAGPGAREVNGGSGGDQTTTCSAAIVYG